MHDREPSPQSDAHPRAETQPRVEAHAQAEAESRDRAAMDEMTASAEASTELGEEIEAALEAILFVSSEPVPVERLLSVFRQKDAPLVHEALGRLKERYRPAEDEPRRGLVLDEAGGGLRLVTRPDLHGHLRTYFEVSGSSRLSMAALETLAIIAYRQPITLPEVQELRGKNSSGVIKTLLERRLVRISGRKEVVGKPFLYSTTRDFLLHFGLSSVDDLPPLEEFEETFGGDSGESLEGEDREEQVLQQLAIVEEGQSDEDEDREREEIDQQRAEAEQKEQGEQGEQVDELEQESDEALDPDESVKLRDARASLPPAASEDGA